MQNLVAAATADAFDPVDILCATMHLSATHRPRSARHLIVTILLVTTNVTVVLLSL